MCLFLIGICNGDDCGCGGFDTSPPDYGWNSPGFSGPDTPASSNGGSTPGGAGAEPSESGGSSGTGNSASDSGSSGGSSTGGVSGSESSSDSALLLAVKGSDYFREGDMNQSLSMLNKSLSIDPYSVRAWMTRGKVLSAMGRYDEAVIAYTQVLLLDPSDESAAAQRGDALMNAGKYPEAIASYDRAIAINPKRSDIQLNRSIAKQLASGAVRANQSVAYQNETAGLNSGQDIPRGILPGTDLTTTIPPGSRVPGTTKSPLQFPLLLVAIAIAGSGSILFRRRKEE